MTLVTDSVLNTLRDAVKDAATYGKGKQRKRLQFAFDAACSQIVKKTLDIDVMSRMNLRARLNALTQENIPEPYANLIKSLQAALRNSDPLYSKDYSDHDEECGGFINKYLSSLVSQIDDTQN